MPGIFGFLIIIFAIIFFSLLGLIISVIRGILRFFGLSSGRSFTDFHQENRDSQRQNNNNDNNDTYRQKQQKNTPTPKKKLFDDDEGEYVEFEEIE